MPFWSLMSFSVPCGSVFQQPADELSQSRPVARVGQGEFEERLEVTLEIADVEAAFARREPDAQHLAAFCDKRADGIGKLDLAALAGARHREQIKDAGS